MSIYDQIGGAAAVSAAVDDFYVRVLGDDSLAPYFEGTDVSKLKGHQRAFIELLPDGRLRSHETWAWESRDGTGTSVIEEVA
jgi:truncated hemoglobin YjbI